MGGARLPPCPPVVLLDMENVRANLGDAAASAKVRVMGERCAEPVDDFWTREALAMPDDRIRRKVCSLLPPGDGMLPLYEALRRVLELSAVGRFWRLAAILEGGLGCLKPSGVWPP